MQRRAVSLQLLISTDWSSRVRYLWRWERTASRSAVRSCSTVQEPVPCKTAECQQIWALRRMVWETRLHRYDNTGTGTAIRYPDLPHSWTTQKHNANLSWWCYVVDNVFSVWFHNNFYLLLFYSVSTPICFCSSLVLVFLCFVIVLLLIRCHVTVLFVCVRHTQ